MEEKKKNRYTKISEFPMNSENPFLQQAINEVNKNVVKKWKNASSTDQKAVLQAVNPETGEILGNTTFVRQIEVDEQQFAKLYLSNFAAFFDLSQASIRVFGYILTCLRPVQDMIYFDIDDCMAYTKYSSKSTIYRGLTELIKSQIIARGKSDYKYYINPMICFNGNRISFVRTYIRKHKPVTEDPNQLTIDFKEE